MALNKTHIIKKIMNSNGFTGKKSAETLEILLEIIKGTLASGEDVKISGFGRFCVKEKKERKGRNPATGKNLMLRPRKVITFRCSGILRDQINNVEIYITKPPDLLLEW